MEAKLYNQLFDKLDSLSAVRKDLTFGCEITTCECNDGCCGIEEGVIGEKYGICEGGKTSYIGTRFSVNIMEVKGHQPVLSDVLKAFKKFWSASYADDKPFDNVSVACIRTCEIIALKWNTSKPLLSEQSDELGEYLLTLLR